MRYAIGVNAAADNFFGTISQDAGRGKQHAEQNGILCAKVSRVKVLRVEVLRAKVCCSESNSNGKESNVICH